MKTQEQSEVIEIKEDFITVLLNNESRKRVPKNLFTFNVLLGDVLEVYLDSRGAVEAIEQKGCFEKHTYTDKATGVGIELCLSPSRVCL